LQLVEFPQPDGIERERVEFMAIPPDEIMDVVGKDICEGLIHGYSAMGAVGDKPRPVLHFIGAHVSLLWFD
jgi:hypothetical protein